MGNFREQKTPAGWGLLLPAILTVCLVVIGIFGISLDLKNQDAEQVQPVNSGLIFSEVCTKNETIVSDNEGFYRDYAELYNSAESVNLKGYYLTNGKVKSAPLESLLLPANSYCVLFIDKELTGFSLGASGGDCLRLMNPDGIPVAEVNTVPMLNDQVMLRSTAGYVVSDNASPGFPNDEAGLSAFQTGTENPNPVLLISEVLAENTSSLPDAQGRFSDAIELYNSGSSPVYLGHYWLSDSQASRFRYRLPAITLKAGEYRVIYCDGENYLGENGEIHANFRLSGKDVLCLTDSNGRYTTLPVSFPGEDVSLALNEEGSYQPSAVSLGFSNDDAGIAAFAQSRVDSAAPLVISEVLLSSADVPYQGEFSDVVEIWNRSKDTVNTSGWFLSDGSDPYAYALPEKNLAPDTYMLVRCSREETGFALSNGELLRLFTPEFQWADCVACVTPQPGQSICRNEDGTYMTASVSLGYANTPDGIQQYEAAQLPQGLRISEAMSANYSYLRGPYGETSDWVELYNGSDAPINLADYCLADSPDAPGQYPLPDMTLAAGEYCVFLLSDKQDRYLPGFRYLPFTLSSEGACLYLTCNGQVLDYAVLPALSTDIAYGRNQSGCFSVLAKATPGAENAEASQVSPLPLAVTAPGAYTAEEGITVELSGSGAIYYTTDCTEPTSASTLYTGPIHLSKTTVIRAVCLEKGKLPSPILDLTYVINGGHNLPVVSLVTAPRNLWDNETGIYQKGPNADPVFPHVGANFWQPWEKAATITLFESDGSGFSSPCGLSIFGAYSRALAIKPFAISFRDTYGAGELNYPLFGEDGLNRYESFVLRCGGQDFLKARVRDVLITSLVAEYTDVAVQKYRPVVLYLNGEFWGVYFIREKINENYVAGNYNVPKEEVQLCEANGYDNPVYAEFMTYVKSHDLSQKANYDYVCSQMDIDEYIDYILAEIYVANTDNGNIKYFKAADGKWTWILYDTDYGFDASSDNTVRSHLNPDGTGHNNAFSTALINALLKNEEFKETFLRRLAWQINTIRTVENVRSHVDALEAVLQQDMAKDQVRWYRHAGSWESHMENLRHFVAYRNQQLPKFVQDYFSLSTAQMREYGFSV